MGAVWFVRGNGKVYGPIDSPALKRLALDGKIDTSTEVAKSQAGPWYPAGKVRGLFEHLDVSAPVADAIDARAPTVVAPTPPPSMPPCPPPSSKLPVHVNLPASLRKWVGVSLVISIGTVVVAVGLAASILGQSGRRPKEDRPPRRVEGSVFIVTQDSRSEKLGLVEVSLFPEASVVAGFKETVAAVDAKLAEADEEIDRERKRLEEAARKLLDQAKSRFEKSDALRIVEIDRKLDPEASVRKKAEQVMQLTDSRVVRQFLEHSIQARRAKECALYAEQLDLLRATAADAQLDVPFFKEAEELLSAEVVFAESRAKYLVKYAAEAEDRVRNNDAYLRRSRERLPQRDAASLEAEHKQMHDSIVNVVVVADSSWADKEEAKQQWSDLVAAIGGIKDLTMTVATLRKARTNIAREELARFVGSLPTPISYGKTDGDGKFVLEVPAEKDGLATVLLARATRKIGENEEVHAWAVRLPQGTSPPGGMLLSNDNEIVSDSKENAVEWPFRPL